MKREKLAQAQKQAQSCAERFRLPMHAHLWRGQAGEFLGAGTGASLDFHDHRPYFPGDDPRHINWQNYARTGQYTMKLYREEVRPVIDLVFDLSLSMFCGEKKALRTAELVHFLTESALRSGADTRAICLNGDKAYSLPLSSVSNLRWWEESEDVRDEEGGTSPNVQASPLRPNALRVLLSDLLYPGSPDILLKALGSGRAGCLIFAPFSEEESHSQWDGQYEFRDVEQPSFALPQKMNSKLLSKLHEAYQKHFSIWKRSCHHHQCKLARISAEVPLERAFTLEAVPQQALEVC